MPAVKFIIPTYKRVKQQLTYKAIPDKYKNDIIFVVREEEYEDMKKEYPNNQVLKLSSNVDNISKTRQWILDKFRQDKVWMLDDNISSFIKVVKVNDKHKKEQLTIEEFDNLLNRINELLNNYVHGALTVAGISMPYHKPLNINSRIMANIFADFSKWPLDVRYDDCDTSEDFYVNLQLLTRGYQNAVIEDNNICKLARQKGGCNSYRDPTYHNTQLKKLNSLYPNFTKLSTKINKSGSWKGKEVCKITCYWKKAYLSTIKDKPKKTKTKKKINSKNINKNTMNTLEVVKVKDVNGPNIGDVNDCGYDFYVPNNINDITLKPGQQTKIPSGLKFNIPEHFGLFFFDRSSVSTKLGLKILAPVVDPSYTGEVHICLFNYTNQDVIIKSGMKITQAVLLPYIKPKIKFVEKFDKESKRGDKGFGSTN